MYIDIKLIVIAKLIVILNIHFIQGQAMPQVNTPAFEQFEVFLDCFNTGKHEEYIKSKFSQGFLASHSLADHLRFFKMIQEMDGGFVIEKFGKSTDYEIVAIVKSKKREVWHRLTFVTESVPPYKVALLSIRQAPRPSAEENMIKGSTEEEVLNNLVKKLEAMEQGNEFSGAVLIVKDDKQIFKQAYGMASKEFDIPNTVTTKFNIGSINKSFTQMAIAQLMEKNKIKLDDPIVTYLSDFPADISNKVTIRHLLTMTSGMGSYWNDEWRTKWAEIKTVQALIDVIKKVPLDFEPGTQQRYSNSGYVVLGAIIEKVSGQSYYDYVRQNIFIPAHMTDTDSYELDQIIPNLAIGYTRNLSASPYNQNKFQNNLFLHSIKGSPAGGGYSTLDDLYKYVIALKKNKLAGPKATNLVLRLFQNIDEVDVEVTDFRIAGGAPIGINAMLYSDFVSGYTVIVLVNCDPPIAIETAQEIMTRLQDL